MCLNCTAIFCAYVALNAAYSPRHGAVTLNLFRAAKHVWFGESLPRAELESAVAASRKSQVFFSIGTSGVVQPAAALAHAARNNGSVVIEVNAEPTPLTPKVDFAFHGRSGEILPELVKAVWG